MLNFLPSEIRAAVEDAAHAEGCQPEELVLEAVQEYLKERHWQLLLSYGRQRARALGYQPSDIDRLIAEYRRENAGHER
jgi:hypothetical protein